MATFVGQLVVVTALCLALGLPLFLVARRMERPTTARRFLIGAAFVGWLSAVLGASSRRLVDQCEAAGNIDCIDAGAAGLQFIAVVGYAIAAWIKAYIVSNE